MYCPKCGSDDTSVTDSRSDSGSIRRRRECQRCNFRFTTYERIELSLPVVMKKDGRREPFDRQKIRAGIARACEKRPVSADRVESAVESIERRTQELCVREIESQNLGDFVMEELKSIDQIAYIRFASVYREFSDVKQFVEALESLSKSTSRKRKSSSDEPKE